MSVTREAQNRFHPDAAFRQVFPHVPEPEQPHTQSQTPGQIQVLKEPVKSRAKVIDLDVALRQPACPVCVVELRIPFLREDQTISRMRLPYCRFLTTISKTFQSIFANRFQHRESRLGISGVGTLNQILIHQRRQALKEVDTEVAT